jgi:diketogulonate reductase-like aldo/keto reductase
MSNMLTESYTLSNGVTIPKLGLGTWLIDDDKAAQAVRDAAATGYRNIDTAEAYGNERGVGEGIRTCGVDRKDIFVSTKLAAEIKDYDGAAAAIDESLRKAGLDYFDLMLIHAPQPWNDFRGGDYAEGNRAAWRALEDAYQAGKLRAIGVANFTEADLESIFATATVTPQVNQVLAHAGNTPLALIDYCQSHNILVQAYSPIAHGAILHNPQLAAMAERYGVSVPQLCIRYTLQLGTQSLPKTANPEHMRANAQVDFAISGDDMAALKALDAKDYGEDAAFPVFSGK